MFLASGGFHVQVTLLDEMEEVFSPLTGPEGTEEMRDNMHYRQYTVNDGRQEIEPNSPSTSVVMEDTLACPCLLSCTTKALTV